MDFNSTLNESVNLTNSSFNKPQEEVRYYSPLFGMDLSMPEWEALLTILALGLVIIITIVGKYDYLHVSVTNVHYQKRKRSGADSLNYFLFYRKYFGNCFCVYIYAFENYAKLLHCESSGLGSHSVYCCFTIKCHVTCGWKVAFG